MSAIFGYVAPQSTNQMINFIASSKETGLLSVIGKMLYFDTDIEGRTYRAIGTVTQIRTENGLFNPSINGVVANGLYKEEASKDIRLSSFVTQAVFVKDAEDTHWSQSAAYLPTSPKTHAAVRMLDENVLKEMTSGMVFPSIGTFRGLDIPMPINTPDFGGRTGSFHTAIVGKSGSGKTASYTMTLGTFMRHEQHAILVVDPQGQWSNENGFLFSPQKFARALGREVTVIRIAEEVKLPKDVDLMGRLIDQMKAWTRLRRMGAENQAIFSQEVAERLVRDNLDDKPRAVLTRAFLSVAKSKAAMRRIYADEKLRDNFKEELYLLAGEDLPDNDANSDFYEPPTAEDLEDTEAAWDSILKSFQPLLNMFSSSNLHKGKRRSLGGEHGILSNIFQVRTASSAPAPYVIVDMSPNVKLHAKKALNKDDSDANMAAMLDKEAVKALILQVLFQEIKKASEVAFAVSGGNLNTQIVFDEAWRYAPEGKAIPEIEELADMLEGFALDTRKFGIGWTYILQSPSDLKRGIWSQLTYIYAAYGLVGGDVKSLEERYSDIAQTEIYRGFIPPSSTGVYPLMIVGSISPLIFTNAPTFLNMFTSPDQFVDANNDWIKEIVLRRGLALVTAESVDPLQNAPKKRQVREESVSKSYRVGKTYETSTPQLDVTTTAPEIDTEDEFGTPF